MSYKKITAEDIAGKGVVGQADTPLLSALEMQNKVEEIVRDVVIPAYNSLIDSIVIDFGNTYSKDEVEDAIARTITEIGAGDMAKSIYDKDGTGVVDDAEMLGGKPPEHYASKEEAQNAQTTAENAMPKVQYVTQTDTDLNDYTEEGFYFFSPDYAPTNIPAGSNGWLAVMTGDNGGTQAIKQIWYRAGTANSNDHNTYIRTRMSGNFSDWAMVITAKGGSFTGEVRADSGASTNTRIRNIMVHNNAGTNISTDYIYMKRK